MKDDEFTKLFKYVQQEFTTLRTDMNGRFDGVDKRIDNLTGAVDAFAKQSESYMQEMLALSHKVDRLERWIMKIAEETGVKLVA